jgi:hypothetical protein
VHRAKPGPSALLLPNDRDLSSADIFHFVVNVVIGFLGLAAALIGLVVAPIEVGAAIVLGGIAFFIFLGYLADQTVTFLQTIDCDHDGDPWDTDDVGGIECSSKVSVPRPWPLHHSLIRGSRTRHAPWPKVRRSGAIPLRLESRPGDPWNVCARTHYGLRLRVAVLEPFTERFSLHRPLDARVALGRT